MRNVFVVGPDKKIKLILVYPMTTGRNFDEVLRVIDSLQLTAKHKVATPVNWKQGDDVIIAGSVSDEDAKKSTPPAGRRRGLTSGSSRSRADALCRSPASRTPSIPGERDGAADEADALSPQQVRLQLVVAQAVGAEADLPRRVDDPVPRNVAVGGQRVQRVPDQPRLTGQSRQRGHLAVGRDAAFRDARDDSVDLRIAVCRPAA